MFLTGLVQLLAGYPNFILENILSVNSGIPAKYKFLPTISEVREECERAVAPYRYAAEFNKGNQHLFLAGPKEPKPTLAELKAKHGENWGLHPDDRVNKPKVYSLGELATKYGVPRETIEALPEGKR